MAPSSNAGMVANSTESICSEEPASADDDSQIKVASSALPADAPFYLGQRNDNASSLAPGYWRWNSPDSTSTHEQIITNAKQSAQDTGWEMTSEHKQSATTYQMDFSKNRNDVVFTVNPEGDSRFPCEYLSETFITANKTGSCGTPRR